MLMAVERAEWYFEGIDEGGNLYDAFDGPIQGVDPRQHTIAGTSDTKGLTDGTSDMEGPTLGSSDIEGSESEASGGTLIRNRWVQFVLPRQPPNGGDSSGGVGGHAEVHKIL